MSKVFIEEEEILREWLRSYDIEYKENMNELNMTNKRISFLSLPIGDSFLKNGSLTKLIFFKNYLSILPDSICDISTLTFLDISSNRLTLLPERIGNLSALIEFYMKDNILTNLPNRVLLDCFLL
eukprot:TRINITY_DN10028_c0_g1_i1.p1 TRINITY_DN10028_c0_g1~~TRINITY_DN10028_c0_g1_i1.p1  ORF type:complete len:125 (-),score=9.68 TRINITY_DN10028_c0_g1_i1:510-884(-)